MGLVLIILLVYTGIYGGSAITREAGSRWSGVAKRVQGQGSPAARAGVGIISGIGWMTRSFGSGVVAAAKDDVAGIRHFFSPAGRVERAEAAAHREKRRRWRKIEKEQAGFRKKAKQERIQAEREAKNQEPELAAPRRAEDYGTGETLDLPDGNGGKSRWFKANDGHQRGPWRNADGMRATDKEIQAARDQTEKAPDDARDLDEARDLVEKTTLHCSRCGHAWEVVAGPWTLSRDCPVCGGFTEEYLAAARKQAKTQEPAAPSGRNNGNGGTMPENNTPTGEAQDYQSMLSELKSMAVTYGQIAEMVQRLAEASERIHATGTKFELDPATLGQISALMSNSLQVAELATGSRSIAAVAGKTLEQQQGGLEEAHAAQPNAADQKFFGRN